MTRIIEGFVRNSVFANILMVVVMGAGLLAWFNMVREIFPNFSTDIIRVSVAFPGADPEEIEESISLKIEEALEGVEGIKQYTTESQEGMGAAMIEVLEDYDVDQVMDRVRSRVDAISTFPVDAEKPIITEVLIPMEVLFVAVSGNLSERHLKELGEDLKERIRALPGVSQVELRGTRDYEIAIELSEERLREYGLTFQQVASTVRRNSMNLAGGTLRTKGEEIRVRTVGRNYTGAEFAKLVVLSRPSGEIITLDRIADIRDAFVEDPVISRLNGQPAIQVAVMKTEEEDAIQIAATVRAFLEQERQRLPTGLTLAVLNDSSEFVRARIDLLLRNGIIGLSLVFLLLWFFLDFRLAFWSSMGIPISLLGGLAFMWFVGATINMISLFGLIMVLGIVVDDAIVVGEAIYVHRRNGDSPVMAAVNGVKEVGMPVLAAVITTIVAFAPLFFVGGIMGKFIAILPVAVISALALSLVECLILLPAHLRALPDLDHSEPRGPRIVRSITRIHRGFNRRLEAFVEGHYAPFIARTLPWRYVVAGIAVGILFMTLGLVGGGVVKFVFFDELDGDSIRATVEFPPGTPVDVTAKAVAQIEDALQEMAAATPTRTGEPLLENVFSLIGATGGDRPQQGSHLGEVRALLLPSEDRGVHTRSLQVAWQDAIGAIPGALALSFAGEQAGPPGKPIEVWLKGERMETILAAAAEVEARLREIDGVYQVQSDYRPGKNEIRLALKPEARSLGLSVEDLARQVYAGYFGEEALRIQRGKDDIRVRVRYPLDERQRLSELDNVRIRTPMGHEVPLRSVANFEYGPGFSTITRVDGQRKVAVTADVDFARANAQEIVNELNASFFPALQTRYPTLTMSLEGEQKNQRESFATLRISGPLALAGILVIVATIFRSYAQPLIILTTVPFGIVGAVWGHLLLGYNLSLMSIFGLVALAGVVVNDAIVLIECVNDNLARGMPFYDAVAKGGARRFRAIFLTTASTVGGLAPLILEQDMQARFLIPMAISLAAGVAFASVLTLVLVPCLLIILNDFRRAAHRLRHGTWPSPEAVEPNRARGEYESGGSDWTPEPVSVGK